jgi:hypothetical protein
MNDLCKDSIMLSLPNWLSMYLVHQKFNLMKIRNGQETNNERITEVFASS